MKLLWEALADLDAYNNAAFYGSYKWGYFHEAKTARFDAAFVQTLNQASWVPHPDGGFVPPGLVVFDSLGWKPNLFLLTKITFKPPIIDQLAKAAGIDPAALDLLRKLGITSLASLTSRLGISNLTPELDASGIPPSPLNLGGGADMGTGAGRVGYHGTVGDKDDGQGRRTPGHTEGRPFMSYVGTHLDDPDPDGPSQAERMKIEEHAINLIIRLEPALRRTPEGNPGFDLFEAASDGRPIRWVEVKSMTGSLENRPVGLSRTQFEFALQKGNAYWLYIVERATCSQHSRVLRIQNPAGRARTFTFDRGWIEIAQTELPTRF